jgi:hypothetical protein
MNPRLLSKADARQYVGGLGEETFKREVEPHVRSRLIGSRRYYLRDDLDAWVDKPFCPSKSTVEGILRTM